MTEPPLQLAQTTFDDVRVLALIEEWDAEVLAAAAGSEPRSCCPLLAEDFAPPRGAFLLATRAGTPAGCGGLRPLGPSMAEVNRLFVPRPERRRGTARALLLALEHRAATIGYRSLRLESDGSPGPLALFRSAGFRELPAEDGDPDAGVWLEKELPRAG